MELTTLIIVIILAVTVFLFGIRTTRIEKRIGQLERRVDALKKWADHSTRAANDARAKWEERDEALSEEIKQAGEHAAIDYKRLRDRIGEYRTELDKLSEDLDGTMDRVAELSANAPVRLGVEYRTRQANGRYGRNITLIEPEEDGDG